MIRFLFFLPFLFLLNCGGEEILASSPYFQFENGKLYYRNKLFNGNRVEDMNEIRRIEPYREGLKHGVETIVHQNGIKVADFPYTDGKRNGEFREWHEDGTYRSYGKYIDDKPVGEFWKWHRNGVPFVFEKYSDKGVLLVTKKWRDTGQIFLNLRFEEGDYIGLDGSKLCDPADSSKLK
ncbi:MAG: hypothetical protein H7A24_17550 [Leptospiraceae bacterium]|nr:hypothetical protein [Leptospiraceae bacterium]MCP5513699.1 hypothetical protein [Leptospiraceae bacterium]